MIGIVTRTYPEWVEEFEKACRFEHLPFVYVDIDRNDWVEQLNDVRLVLWRIHLGDPIGLMEAKIKIPIMEKMGIFCYPSQFMADLYKNKILQTFLMRKQNIPIPSTFISFSEAEALERGSMMSWPVVAKTSGGASATGVIRLNKLKEMKSFVNRQFGKRPTWLTLIQKILRRLINISILGSKDFPGYVYFQEYIESDGDWRITTMGENLVSVFKRYNRPGDFRASGSGLWKKITVSEIPKAACDLALVISTRNGFTSMAYDFIQQGQKWLLLEFSYSFLLNPIYTNTLFEKNSDGYRAIDPIPIGTLHLRACLSFMNNRKGN